MFTLLLWFVLLDFAVFTGQRLFSGDLKIEIIATVNKWISQLPSYEIQTNFLVNKYMIKRAGNRNMLMISP